MMNLYYQGGALFMGVLTLLFFAMLVFSTLNVLKLAASKVISRFQLNAVKSIGLLAMVIGILGQLIGLYAAFESIEQMGQVSQSKLVAGLKVSSITTMYGITIFMISYMIWFALSYWNDKQKN